MKNNPGNSNEVTKTHPETQPPEVPWRDAIPLKELVLDPGQEFPEITITEAPVKELPLTYSLYERYEGDIKYWMNPRKYAPAGTSAIHEVCRVIGHDLEPQILLGKLLSDDLSSKSREHAEREAKLLAFVSSRTFGVPKIYELMIADDKVVILMEKIKGPNLDEILMKFPYLISKKMAVNAISQIAKTIDVMNANGILHRDLKTSNIVMDEENNGYARVVDLGVANIARPDLGFPGTYGFRHPDIAQNGIMHSIQTEIWSLKAIAKAMIVYSTHDDFLGMSASEKEKVEALLGSLKTWNPSKTLGEFSDASSFAKELVEALS